MTVLWGKTDFALSQAAIAKSILGVEICVYFFYSMLGFYLVQTYARLVCAAIIFSTDYFSLLSPFQACTFCLIQVSLGSSPALTFSVIVTVTTSHLVGLDELAVKYRG